MFFICCDTFSLTLPVFRVKKRNKPFLSDINDSSGVSQKFRIPMVADTAEARCCNAYVMFFAKEEKKNPLQLSEAHLTLMGSWESFRL